MSSALLETIGKAISQHAPEAFSAIAQTLAAQGIDLGPMTPDARKDFDAVDVDIDKQLRDAADEVLVPRPKPTPVHDTDPAMPAVPAPKPSER